MVITAGIDAGLQNIKVAILKGKDILSLVNFPACNKSIAVATLEALKMAAEQVQLLLDDIEYITATGSGMGDIPFVKNRISEFICLTKGINYFFPSVDIVLDIGVQKTLVVKCKHGMPIKIGYNDRCASGTGRYLEMAANILGLQLEESGRLSLQSESPVEVTSNCAVFAESEIISLVHAGNRPEDILKGVYKSLASSLYPLLLKTGLEKNSVTALCGGVVKNMGIVEALREMVGNLYIPDQPEMISAIGAALHGLDE
ncbi:MAG: acyl-CoA dehydratase activase [Thermodesulfobacteriota bacterium]|nr:acyl-CoA dehydratase activase [Thermodesulfobacteriota bacterium]